MILLLRHSRLGICASTLERSRLEGTKLFLYTQKTGTPLRVPLPQRVVDALHASLSDDPRYFFWNGQCRRTSAEDLETTFKTVFKKADVEDGHIHRFRDTLAVRAREGRPD